MSWFARALANSLSLADDDTTTTISSSSSLSSPSPLPSPSPSHTEADSSPRGVREDLSEITKTLTRQFWGVASFLAPPPLPSPSPAIQESNSGDSLNSCVDSSSSTAIDGIRSDFEEIRGRFRSEISRFSSNKAVSEITKMASSLLSLGLDEGKASVDEYKARGVLGISEEVVAFVKDISMRPETWLDFPFPDSDDCHEFDLSEIQQEHAMAVESLVPSLGALRIELCPVYMTEGYFWKIYFLLLQPKLTDNRASFLSAPMVIKEAGGLSEKDAPPFSKKDPLLEPDFPEESSPCPTTSTQKAPLSAGDGQVKDVKYEEKEDSAGDDEEEDSAGEDEEEDSAGDDGDEWLNEEDGLETRADPGRVMAEEEEVSFSDLEVEDDEPGFRGATTEGGARARYDGSGKEWVRLDVEDIE